MFESEKERIPIYVDFDRLVRYHFGIFGFTGCGKSNLLSNILRRLVYHTATRIVVFDISAEYPFLLQDALAASSIVGPIIGGFIAQYFELRASFIASTLVISIALLIAIIEIRDPEKTEGSVRARDLTYKFAEPSFWTLNELSLSSAHGDQGE